MKTLLISQSQDGSYINILYESLKKLDCSLTVFSGKLTSDINSNVEKIQSIKYESNSFSSRLRTWMAFTRDAKQYLKKNIESFDLVLFTSNPPVNQQLVSYVQKKNKKCAYLIWDIYPDTIEKAFGKKVHIITSIWRKKNAGMYRKCNHVFTIGSVMKEVLIRDYPNLDIDVIPYHTDTTFIQPIPDEENFFIRENGLCGKTVFMYSGKMGFGHGFSEILEAAELLKDRNDICFVLIGFGASFDEVKNYVQKHEMENTKVLPYQPLEVLPYSLSSAAVSFITIKPNNDGLFLPSKVYDAMASGSAILCISDGQNDITSLINQYELGQNVPAGNAELLAQTIKEMTDNQERLEKYRKHSRETSKQFDVKQIIAMYEKLFEKLLQGEL